MSQNSTIVGNSPYIQDSYNYHIIICKSMLMTLKILYQNSLDCLTIPLISSITILKSKEKGKQIWGVLLSLNLFH